MDGELLSLKWNNHRTTFYHVISGLRNKESYTDVTLACDGKFYPVHKLVLSTCSEYFNDIFDRTPCKNPVVVLKDIQCRDLEFLLDYMYIGEVNVRQNELSSLIKAAECLRVKGLAVPDEEPKKSVSASSVSNSVPQSSSSSRQRPEQSSPPAKRRRAEERRATPVASDHSPGRPPGDGSLGSPDVRETPSTAETSRLLDQSEDVQGDISEQTPIVIKEERQDTQDNLVNVQNSYDVGGEDDGDGPHDSEGNTSASDFPEFLQSTIEKEEPVAISEFNPDFPGPSGLQNSGLAPWESENSSAGFPEGLSGAVAAAVAAVSQPQQRQQQQLWAWPSTLADEVKGGGGCGDGGSSFQDPREVGCSKEPASSRWQCNFCGYVAQRRQHLQAHICTHTGEKPHHCPHCAYKCSDIGNLKKHIRIHSEDKPYSCPECSFSTRTAAALKKHMIRHAVPISGVGSSSLSDEFHSWSHSSM